jgi:CDP-diacylglycerol--serine O-phosphatidyltransferase
MTPTPENPEPRAGRRKRRTRSEGRAFTALLPHLLTTANLAAGFYAVLKAGEGEFDRAAIALFFAAVFDGLDGRVARMARATSRFGVEYDSIADTVSFGVAPAVLAFNAGAYFELGWTGWVMAFIYMACAALRLARFNVSPGRFEGRFEGLPSPAAAGVVLSWVLFSGWLSENGIVVGVPATLSALGLASLGILMVSPIPYRNFKDLRLRGSYWNIVWMVIGSTVILMRPELTFLLIATTYLFSGPFEIYWRRRTGSDLESIQPQKGAGSPAAPGDRDE